MNDYFVLHIENVLGTQEELLSEKVFSNGALGMSEVLPFEQPEGEEEVFTQLPDRRAMDIYFATTPPASLIEELSVQFPQIEIRIQGEQNRDWLAEWKKGFAPFALTKDHWVVPSWCEPPIEAKHKIWIDPGMAFGTGTHETTQLVAEELAALCASQTFKSALDVGTGTGILAVLARQLGIQEIRATEIEEDSRRVARETFARNECTDIGLESDQLEDLNQSYEIVMANIIDGVLVRIQEDLKGRVKAGGWLLLSGIIAEREKDFLQGFRLPSGRKWDIRRQKGDWLLYGVRL